MILGTALLEPLRSAGRKCSAIRVNLAAGLAVVIGLATATGWVRRGARMKFVICPRISGFKWFVCLLLLVLVCGGGRAEEASVRPGINAPYFNSKLGVAEWVRTFEGESREIYAQRHAIVDALGLAQAMAVADVGTGTGLFVPLIAARIGSTGQLYAVDIVPQFAAHVRDRVAEAGLGQVTVVLSHERSVNLPAASVDLAFMCDVYHHLEYPQSVLASLRRALKPGGTLVVIDFERIPGVTRDWILQHVRADRATVAREIEAAGFTAGAPLAVPGVKENYLLSFTRP